MQRGFGADADGRGVLWGPPRNVHVLHLFGRSPSAAVDGCTLPGGVVAGSVFARLRLLQQWRRAARGRVDVLPATTLLQL